MNAIDKKFCEIDIKDAINIIENKNSSNINSIVREINKNMNIRNGKYGDYLYYKTDCMKKPQFFKIQSFPDDYKKCNLYILKDWIREKYNI